MALVEAVFGEQHHLLEQPFGHTLIHTPFGGALHEQALVFLHLALFLLPHCPPQQVGLTKGIAGQILGNAHDLLLVDHDSVGFLENRLQARASEIDRFAAVLAVDELGNQPRIQGAWPVERQDR